MSPGPSRSRPSAGSPRRRRGAERRRAPRRPVSWPVRMWIDERPVLGRAIDVSERGLCVLTGPTRHLRRGESCRIDVLVDATQQLALVGEVRHAESSLVRLRTVERLRLV